MTRNCGQVKRTERGWAGHFICANRCRFRRNTLLEYNDIKIVISTVGLMEKREGLKTNEFEQVGAGRYFETMAFHAKRDDARFHDIDVSREVNFDSPWQIGKIDADNKANDMHEMVVNEITQMLVDNKIKYEERIDDNI
jgi:hypothetical protein